ncbi:MAG: metal-dependent hydrolase [Thermosphaera sp.]
MRGWTHYLSGLAMVTFFPNLLADLAKGLMWPVLAGIYAYLPDFLDFKFRKFIWRRDVVVDPAPHDPRSKISPRRIRIADLNPNERWRFYYLEGFVEKILVNKPGLLEFELKDETGLIKVVARNEDYEKFTKVYKSLERGARVRVPGYLEIDEESKLPYWNFADAPHPNLIAQKISEAIDKAYESGGMVTVKILNIRMPGDVYRRFLVEYHSREQKIMVHMGPLVSTGGLPFEGTETPAYRRMGEARTRHPFKKVYPRPTVIDSFNGPEIGFVKVKENGMEIVEEVFIPWHRGFTHSFTAGTLLSLPIFIFTWLLGYAHATDLALACMLGYWMHVVEDQIGFMGSILLPPLTKRRIQGLMIGPRIPGLMNFATSWLMISLIIWNINRYIPAIGSNGVRPISIPDAPLLLILTLPSIVIYGAGLVDKMIYMKKLKSEIKERTEEEVLEDVEEVGGY